MHTDVVTQNSIIISSESLTVKLNIGITIHFINKVQVISEISVSIICPRVYYTVCGKSERVAN